MKDSARKFNLFLIPSFASKLISRKYNLRDLSDFSKLKEVFSVYDIATILAMNNDFLYATPFWNKNVDLPSWDRTDLLINADELPPEDNAFYKATICPYLYSEEFKKNAFRKYLEEKDISGNDPVPVRAMETIGKQNKELPFKIFVVNTSVYIIVEEGFGAFFTSNEVWLDFLKRVLKSSYTVSPLKEVNGYEVYGQYIAAHAAKQ